MFADKTPSNYSHYREVRVRWLSWKATMTRDGDRNENISLYTDTHSNHSGYLCYLVQPPPVIPYYRPGNKTVLNWMKSHVLVSAVFCIILCVFVYSVCAHTCVFLLWWWFICTETYQQLLHSWKNPAAISSIKSTARLHPWTHRQ